MIKFILNLFGFRNFPQKHIIAPMIVFGSLLISIFCSQLISMLAKYFPSSAPQELTSLSEVIASSEGTFTWILILFIGLIFPIIEELCFRGILWRITEALKISNWLRILFVSVVFSSLHSELLWIIGVFPLAIWLGYLRYRFNSIFPGMIAHISVNCGTIIWLVLQ